MSVKPISAIITHSWQPNHTAEILIVTWCESLMSLEKGNMPDSKGTSWSHRSLFKTLLDRDQYVTELKNSSRWPDIYFWMASATPWIQSSRVRPPDLSTFHIFTSHLKHAICTFFFFFKSNSPEVYIRPKQFLLQPKQNVIFFLQCAFLRSGTLNWLCDWMLI